jgi:hypothetical protein
VGIEATQAVQFFNFNNQGSGTGADNTVPLVAHKPMVLRVYLDTYDLSIPGVTVTGELSYFGFTEIRYPINREFGQYPGRITARAGNTIDRGNINHTLNFLIPGEHCFGTLPISLSVYLGSRAGIVEFYRSGNFEARFRNVNIPGIHGVLVRYTGNDAAGNPTNIAPHRRRIS